MAAHSLLIFSLVIYATAFSINLSHADPRTDYVMRMCGKVHVQNVSNYFKYYSNITDYMQDEIYRNKFAFKDVGEPPDRLYVLAQCMDDLTNEECAMCFTQISTLIPSCFPSTGGRVYFDGCFIRAENYSFYREVLGPEDTKRCSGIVNKRQEFSVAVDEVLSQMLLKAPSFRGFASMHETSNGISAYGMASCWKILDRDLCSNCLSEAVASALSCIPSTEARVLNAGCFLRYSDTSFANDSNGGDYSEEEVFSYVTYIMGVGLICVFAIGIGVCVGKLSYRRKIRLKQSKETEDLVLEERVQYMQFKYATLDTATQSFSDSNRLGRGGFGEVFKGTLPDGREIAIKRLYISRKFRVQEIRYEMDIIGRAQHKNLAWKHFQSSTVQEIIDKSMAIEDAEEIQRVVQIGLLCTQESPNLRPTMTEVVQMLRKEGVELPSPSKPPFTDELMELNYLGSFDRHHPSGLST
ncbi:hypothetical protein OIU79_000556 [Salix purpurea]|uniref:Uncharacterized protein n=1 Tax=Salix purpurea TaxID=77065 RepID=A0A9Q0ZN45_SALPP|nr:hypothetical protein OIU79_000556 [Salix purpurea]